MSELALSNVSPQDACLRIALLGYRSNPYSGGQGVYLKFLSRALVAAGHRVDVISGEPYPELDPQVRLYLGLLSGNVRPRYVARRGCEHIQAVPELDKLLLGGEGLLAV